MKTQTRKEFETFSSAFDYCREANQPVVVVVEGETWKLYPSGKGEPVITNRAISQTDD